MDDNEYTERIEAIGELVDAYPSTEVTEKTVISYVWSLSDLSVPALRTAIAQVRNKSKFFPPIAEIREQAEAIKGKQNESGHPDSCKCFGTGWEQYKEGGYLQVKKCDKKLDLEPVRVADTAPAEPEYDPVDDW